MHCIKNNLVKGQLQLTIVYHFISLETISSTQSNNIKDKLIHRSS